MLLTLEYSIQLKSKILKKGLAFCQFQNIKMYILADRIFN